MVNNLKTKYQNEVVPKLIKEFKLDGPMAAPKLQKIVVNMGTGEKLRDREAKEVLMADMAQITGQKPKIQQARLSVAGFGIRAGQPVGLTVTLRGDRMYHFLEKLISIVLPRIRDFRGVSKKSFDNAGNYTLGFREYSVFPEIDITKAKVQGLEITIVTNSGKQQAFSLLTKLGMPFEKGDEQ